MLLEKFVFQKRLTTELPSVFHVNLLRQKYWYGKDKTEMGRFKDNKKF